MTPPVPPGRPAARGGRQRRDGGQHQCRDRLRRFRLCRRHQLHRAGGPEIAGPGDVAVGMTEEPPIAVSEQAQEHAPLAPGAAPRTPPTKPRPAERRAGLSLDLKRLDALSEETPVLVDLSNQNTNEGFTVQLSDRGDTVILSADTLSVMSNDIVILKTVH